MDGEDFKTGEATVSVKGFLSNGEEAEVAKIYVKQIAPHILVSKREFKANPDGDTINLTLWSDYDWTVESDSDWCVVNGNSKAGVFTNDAGKVITLTVKDGWVEGDYGNRLAVITAKNINTGETIRVYVSQPSNPKETFFNISDNTFTVKPEGETLNFNLVCNKNWTVKSNQDWCVIDEEDRSGSDTSSRGRYITFTVDDGWDSGYYGTRNVVITVKKMDTGETLDINVSQTSQPKEYFFNISATSLDVDPEGGTVNFTLVCNKNWTVKSNRDWCVIDEEDRSGTNTELRGRKINFSVDDLWSAGYYGTRNAVITAKNTNTGETAKIKISHLMSVLKVSTTSFDVGLEGATLSFDLKCNYDWALENDSDWCVFASSDMSGGDTGPDGRHITFTVKDGWTGGYHGDRQAVITARNLNSGETVRIYVHQGASLYSADYFFNVSAHNLTASP